MSRIRVASVNVNGIRAAYRKGMAEWLSGRDVDVLTIQEVRATRADLTALLGDEWIVVNDEATAKGRAGVAVAWRANPVEGSPFTPVGEPRTELGAPDFDSAGRWIEADFDVEGHPLTVVSAYVHSGEAETPKQEEKWRFLDAMQERLAVLASSGRSVLITGDLNVGHRELDIKNWRGNVKRAGFLPRERSYFDRFFGEAGAEVTTVDGSGGTGLGFIDVGRAAHGEVDGPYSWWSWRGQAFDNDTGWRIDYHMATPDLAARATNYTIDRAPTWDTRWSDHAPVVADYVF